MQPLQAPHPPLRGKVKPIPAEDWDDDLHLGAKQDRDAPFLTATAAAMEAKLGFLRPGAPVAVKGSFGAKINALVHAVLRIEQDAARAHSDQLSNQALDIQWSPVAGVAIDDDPHLDGADHPARGVEHLGARPVPRQQ